MDNIENWRYICYEELGSTNDEIKKFCQKTGKKTIVRAVNQTAGRGRRGRRWIAQAGNLFFSMAFEFDLKNLGQLVIISSLSIVQTVKLLSGDVNIQLKWPNDVLIDGCKTSGILIEKADGEYMIVGIGVNILSSPENSELLYPSTSLAEKEIVVDADVFLRLYVRIFNENLQILAEGKGEVLRDKWLKYAKGIGREIVVKQENKEIRGIFDGIDEQANLLIRQGKIVQKIMVGDVFYEEEI